MTTRQARTITWGVLLPLTLVVRAQFLPPSLLGCATKITKIQDRLPPPYEPTIKRYTVCSIAGPCWEVQGEVR